MACPAVLGAQIHEAAVYDQSILGGTRMIVYPARLDLLGSGAQPRNPDYRDAMVDELDIADLDSETAHAYQALESGHDDRSNRLYTVDEDSDDMPWADGGRFERVVDTFEAHLPQGADARAVARFVGPEKVDARLVVMVQDRRIATLDVPAARAIEVSFDIPAELAGPTTPVRVQALSGYFGSLHYWFVKPRNQAATR